MNSRRTIVLAIAAALAVHGCSSPSPQGPLAGSAIGGAFSLIDQNGKTFTDADLRGRYSLVYFGYTFCPDVCPLDVQKLSAGLAAFEKTDPALGAKVVPVFVTVDPERDNPAALKAFAANFHPRLVALTGTRPQVDAAIKAYRIYAKRAGPEGKPDYLMDHMSITYLMGPDGKPIAFTGHDATPEQITTELKTYVR